MFGLDASQLIIILLIIVIIFAGSQLPRLSRNLRSSEKEVDSMIEEDGTIKPPAKKKTTKKTK